MGFALRGTSSVREVLFGDNSQVITQLICFRYFLLTNLAVSPSSSLEVRSLLVSHATFYFLISIGPKRL